MHQSRTRGHHLTNVYPPRRDSSERDSTPPYSVVSKQRTTPVNPGPTNYPALPGYPPGVSEGPPQYEFIETPSRHDRSLPPPTPTSYNPTPSPGIPELPPKLKEFTTNKAEQPVPVPPRLPRPSTPPELPPKPTPPSRSSSLKRSTRSSISSRSRQLSSTKHHNISRSRPGQQSLTGSEAPLIQPSYSATSLTEPTTGSASLPTGLRSSATTSLESFGDHQAAQLLLPLPPESTTPISEPVAKESKGDSSVDSGKQRKGATSEYSSLLSIYSAHTLNKQVCKPWEGVVGTRDLNKSATKDLKLEIAHSLYCHRYSAHSLKPVLCAHTFYGLGSNLVLCCTFCVKIGRSREPIGHDHIVWKCALAGKFKGTYLDNLTYIAKQLSSTKFNFLISHPSDRSLPPPTPTSYNPTPSPGIPELPPKLKEFTTNKAEQPVPVPPRLPRPSTPPELPPKPTPPSRSSSLKRSTRSSISSSATSLTEPTTGSASLPTGLRSSATTSLESFGDHQAAQLLLPLPPESTTPISEPVAKESKGDSSVDSGKQRKGATSEYSSLLSIYSAHTLNKQSARIACTGDSVEMCSRWKVQRNMCNVLNFSRWTGMHCSFLAAVFKLVVVVWQTLLAQIIIWNKAALFKIVVFLIEIILLTCHTK
eukprot:sb/3462873/